MFKILENTKEDVIAFEASGKIEASDYDKLDPLLQKTEKEYPSLKLYIVINEIRGISIEALFKDIVTYFKHIRKVNKVAVVGKPGAEKTWAKIADPFIKADIKYFKPEESELAMDWIKA